MKVAAFLKDKTGYNVNPDAMFDVQVVCLHDDPFSPLSFLLHE